MARSLGYVRVSARRQAKSGLGLADQRRAITEASERLGLELATVYEDAAVSGRKGLEDRPGLFDAIQALEPGDVLLVAKRCRLGRDVVELGLIERQISKRGARVISAAGEGTEADSGDPTALFLRRILDAVNELEVAQIRARTRAALRAKLRRGERLGRPPFGWNCPGPGKPLVQDAAEQRVIAAILDAAARGLSQREIVRELERLGFRTRGGRPFQRTQVRRILSRAKVA